MEHWDSTKWHKDEIRRRQLEERYSSSVPSPRNAKGNGTSSGNKSGGLFLGVLLVLGIIAYESSHNGDPGPTSSQSPPATYTDTPHSAKTNAGEIAKSPVPQEEATIGPSPKTVLPPPSSQYLTPILRIRAETPPLAVETSTYGDVSIAVLVLPDGTVQNATARNGAALLIPAALRAAEQWRFEPFEARKGEETRSATVTFHFAPKSQ